MQRGTCTVTTRPTDIFDLPNTQTWMGQAACRSCLEEDLFFPDGDSHRYDPQIAAAKAYCEACPVVEQCLAFAMGIWQIEGIWGGTTEKERRQAKRREQWELEKQRRARMRTEAEAARLANQAGFDILMEATS